MNKLNTDEVLTKDAHLIQSFADLNGLKQADARTVIVEAQGAFVTDSEGNKLIAVSYTHLTLPTICSV